MPKDQSKYYAYHQEWDKNNTKQFKIKLNKRTDAEMIEWLENLPNRQGYLKELISKDMKEKKNADK